MNDRVPAGAIDSTVVRIYQGMQRLKHSTTREGLAMNAVRLAGGADALRSLGILNDEEWTNLLETISDYEDEAKRICESEWTENDCCSICWGSERGKHGEKQSGQADQRPEGNHAGCRSDLEELVGVERHCG